MTEIIELLFVMCGPFVNPMCSLCPARVDAVRPRHLNDLISTFRLVTHIGSLKASSCAAG